MSMTISLAGRTVELPDRVLTAAEAAATEMMDPGELAHLAATLALCPRRSGAIVAEIGTYHGRTAVFMAQALEALGISALILSIDPFERARPDDLNPQGSFRTYLDTIRDARMERVCLPLVAFSEDAAAVVPDNVGVLVVDGNHDYPAVRRDLELFGPKVLPGGFIFADDYGPAYPGVMRAIDEYFADGGPFTVVHKSYFVIAQRT